MLKRFQGKILGKDITITKLPASRALKIHAQVARFLAGALGEISEGLGGTDEEQKERLGKAMSAIFSSHDDSEEVATFIETALTCGDVVLGKERIDHLDDLERYDDIDGTEFMYLIFAEWAKLNLGSIIKKIGSTLAG